MDLHIVLGAILLIILDSNLVLYADVLGVVGSSASATLFGRQVKQLLYHRIVGG